jgi:hypothetical protein
VEVAEIKVERRERSVLPWIVGLIALALIAFAAYRVLGTRGGAAVAGDNNVVVDSARP